MLCVLHLEVAAAALEAPTARLAATTSAAMVVVTSFFKSFREWLAWDAEGVARDDQAAP